MPMPMPLGPLLTGLIHLARSAEMRGSRAGPGWRRRSSSDLQRHARDPRFSLAVGRRRYAVKAPSTTGRHTSPTSIIPPTSIDCLLASALPFCTSSSIPPSSAHRICLPSPWRWSFENLVLPRLALARPAGRESARTPSPRSPLPKSSTFDALYKVPRDAVHILGKGSSLVVIASGAVGHLALPLALVSSPPYRSGSRAPKARHTLARN
ncbi:unnamed protein product [Diplocarpon coronariae]